jgi:hypothetical protein
VISAVTRRTSVSQGSAVAWNQLTSVVGFVRQTVSQWSRAVREAGSVAIAATVRVGERRQDR